MVSCLLLHFKFCDTELTVIMKLHEVNITTIWIQASLLFCSVLLDMAFLFSVNILYRAALLYTASCTDVSRWFCLFLEVCRINLPATDNVI